METLTFFSKTHPGIKDECFFILCGAVMVALGSVNAECVRTLFKGAGTSTLILCCELLKEKS